MEKYASLITCFGARNKCRSITEQVYKNKLRQKKEIKERPFDGSELGVLDGVCERERERERASDKC